MRRSTGSWPAGAGALMCWPGAWGRGEVLGFSGTFKCYRVRCTHFICGQGSRHPPNLHPMTQLLKRALAPTNDLTHSTPHCTQAQLLRRGLRAAFDACEAVGVSEASGHVGCGALLQPVRLQPAPQPPAAAPNTAHCSSPCNFRQPGGAHPTLAPEGGCVVQQQGDSKAARPGRPSLFKPLFIAGSGTRTQ